MSVPQRFAKIHIEISNVCNLACSFCPEVKRQKGQMPVADFRSIIAQVSPYAEQICLHLMGEPLLHPDLARIVDACEEFGSKIFLVSNGVLLKKDSSALLLRRPFRQVNFSLHSFRDNFGDRSPAVYLQKIFAFVERAIIDRPDLYINFRLWNLKDPRGSGAHNLAMLDAIKSRFDIPLDLNIDVRSRKSVHLKERLYLHFDSEFIWPDLSLPFLGQKGRCYGLSSHFGILVDGTVVPCCLDKEGVITLGNIHRQPLLDILNAPRAQAMIKGFKKGQLVEELCQKCNYIERFSRKRLGSAPRHNENPTMQASNLAP